MGFFQNLLQNKNERKAHDTLSKTSRADEQRIIETLALRRLDSMPTQAARAFQLSCDPKSTLEDFIKIIEADEVLTARILKIANSVYFRRGEQAKDIISAVANIGLNEIKCLLSAAMLKSLLQGNSKYRNTLWANSVGTAIACKHISGFTSVVEGEAFLCGLLHDVGKLILLQRLPQKYEKIIHVYHSSGKASPLIEEEFLDLTHIEVGKWLAEKWNFPESVRRAISFHHQKWPEENTCRGKKTSPAMLVKCGNNLSHMLKLGHSSQYSKLSVVAEEERERICTQLSINKEQLLQIEKNILRQFDSEFSLYTMEG